MKEKAFYILRHPLISGSSIIFIGSFAANILNYIFNLSVGRLLSVSDYGLYFTLISIFGLFTVFQLALTGIFAKFSAKYIAREDKGLFNTLLLKGFKYLLIISLLLFVSFLSFSSFLSTFLNMEDTRLIILISLSIFVTLLTSLPQGILQGQMKFKILSFLNALAPLLKIVLGFSFLYLGFKIFGVMAAVFLSFLISYIISMSFIYKNFKKNNDIKSVNERIFIDELKNYSFRFFLASLGIVIITNGDIILVRHFFDPVISGQYAALSLMGKAILYLTTPLYFVFFPLIAQKKEKKEKLFGTLFLAGIIIAMFSLGLSFVYFIFPNLIIKIFFPSKEYMVLAPYLGPFSLYIFVLSLVYLFNNFFLSIGKTSIYKINILSSLLLVVLIFIFHNSLFQIISILFSVSFLLLVLLLVYYKQNENN